MRPRTIKADDPPKMQDEVIREFPHWAYFTFIKWSFQWVARYVLHPDNGRFTGIEFPEPFLGQI